ncbi:hypothetical protein S40293_09579 [Stachybotrys chartarum IBT 40293]|nr:hypothetical protein S40293_09579 [Stachybotrys chartarum IBT 40293]
MPDKALLGGDESDEDIIISPKPNETEVRAKDLLTAAKSVDFDKDSERDAFVKKHKEVLKRASNSKESVDGNILHALAGDSEDEWWNSAGDGTKAMSFLRWIVKEHPQMLECQLINNGYLPIHVALYRKDKRHGFVGIVLDTLAPEGQTELHPTLVRMLQHRNLQEETCLHLAVKHGSKHAARIIKLCAQVVQLAGSRQAVGIFGQQSKINRETALHYAVRLSKDDPMYDLEFLTQQKRAVASHPKAESLAGDKPALNEWELIGLKPVVRNDLSDETREIVQLLLESDTENKAILAKMEYKADKKEDVYNLTPFQAREADFLQVIKGLYKAKAKDAFPPDRFPDKQKTRALANSLFLPAAITEVRGQDEILTMMKLFFIEKFRTDRKKLLQALYEPGDERHLEFSLSGLRGQTVTNDYLTRLVKHLKFESILTCVSLPSLAFETQPTRDGLQPAQAKMRSGEGDSSDSAQQKAATDANQNGKGRKDLVSVFSWLRENHVRTIKRVVVIDDGDRPHSDEAIEEALRGFDVESWDWKKPDICSDVIHSTAPNVREGLESKQRLVKHIEKFQSMLNESVKTQKASRMRSIHKQLLQSHPENAEKDDFEIVEDRNPPTMSPASVELETGEEVQIVPAEDPGFRSFRSSFKSISTRGSQKALQIFSDNKWLRNIEPVSKFIRSIADKIEQAKKKPTRDGSREEPTVSIAIIDDGIDAFLDRFDGKIISGASFCSANGFDDSTEPYFLPSSDQHGTLMAALILRVFPRARLYVAKLDERSGGMHGKRHITTRSATEAIEWAVRCKVDIISMSWTIERSTKTTEEINALTQALNKAKSEHKILMLCAASDQGNSTRLFCYPASSNHCLRVGASTGTGERCDWVHENECDILLPGENVPLDLRIDTLPTEHSGSSVATAIASGLAGLILYLARYSHTEKEYKKLELTGLNEMHAMFRFLASYSPSNPKSPQVSQLSFLKDENLITPGSEEKTKEKVRYFFKGYQDYMAKANR